jgi:hypothetical protein
MHATWPVLTATHQKAVLHSTSTRWRRGSLISIGMAVWAWGLVGESRRCFPASPTSADAQPATRSTQLAITFTTHAHHIDDRLARDLRGNVHFIRVSIDGVGATYERIRGRPFAQLLARLRTIGNLSKFGINFVVNAQTFADLDCAIAIASDSGACEFLLLPEQPTSTSSGIDLDTAMALRAWIHSYRGSLPLLVSEAGAEGISYCTPIPNETALDAYAHIDAKGIIKDNSFTQEGVRIGEDGIIAAFACLRRSREENIA